MNNKQNNRPSIFFEILNAIVDFFLGSIYTKVGWALAICLIGILVLIRPFTDAKGNNIEKSYVHYLVGSLIIALAIGLFISWLKNRKAKSAD